MWTSPLKLINADAINSDVDEAPTTQTMFIGNLSSEDPIYDEAGTSYDSNTQFERKLEYKTTGYVLNFSFQYTKLSQELVEYVIGTCPKEFTERDSKAPSIPLTRKKQVTFTDTCSTSTNNTQKHGVHQKTQPSNVQVIPSTGVSSSTRASGSKPRSNTKHNRILPAKSVNNKKVEDHPRTNKSVWTKVNRVDSSISSKHVVINSNSESVCKTCNKCLNSANHEMCVVNILSSVNATPTVKIVLNKGKQIWKPKGKLSDNSLNKTKQIWQPKGKLSDNSLNKTKQVWKATGKLFANVGYQWRPTGKKFTSGRKLNCGLSMENPTERRFSLGELCTLTRTSCEVLLCQLTNRTPTQIGDPKFQTLQIRLFSNAGGTDHPLVSGLRLFKTRVRGMNGSYIRKGNLLLDLQKLQKNPIFCISVDIRQNTNFVRAFTTSANVPSIYIQLFWNTLTHDAKTEALNVTPADSAHPFESPPAGKTDITFTRRRVPSNWLMKMKFNRLLNLIWMIMSTIYNKRWIIASQDDTTGPSVHPEDATSTKMVCETLSHADAESGGNSEKINSETDTEILNVGSNSKQSHVALAGPNPEHMQDVFLATNYPKWEADDEEMAPVRISSGPEPIMMTPGQLNSGLAPSPVPATTYIPPTDKDLEILFQPMFDEYFDQSTDSEPVPTATVVNALIVSTNTSVSTTIAQDAPSTTGPTIEDTLITQADIHPSVNPVAGEPGSAQSTSGDVSLAEPNQVNQPPDHL
ncbi:hypothetical protein Tco_1429948 [Tanacetum coccineum]